MAIIIKNILVKEDDRTKELIFSVPVDQPLLISYFQDEEARYQFEKMNRLPRAKQSRNTAKNREPGGWELLDDDRSDSGWIDVPGHQTELGGGSWRMIDRSTE